MKNSNYDNVTKKSRFALDSAYSTSYAPDESTATASRMNSLNSKEHPQFGTEMSKSTSLWCAECRVSRSARDWDLHDFAPYEHWLLSRWEFIWIGSEENVFAPDERPLVSPDESLFLIQSSRCSFYYSTVCPPREDVCIFLSQNSR